MKKFLGVLLCVAIFFQLSVIGFAADRVAKENEDIELPSTFTSSVPDGDDVSKLPVDVKAKSAVLMDVATGKVLMEYNADVKLFPASVTKIMTILLVAEAITTKRITLADKVPCSQNAASKGGSQIWLEEGEQMSVDELLRATVIGSANDAATLLGEYISGSEEAFINLMNARAKELGMKNTHFVNATGLDDATDEHLTTSRDIALMSCELLKHEFITEYTTVWMDSLRNGETELVNTNKLVRFYEGTTGLKTGTTAKAGCCVSASAKRDNLHLVAVVMGSENSTDRFETAKAMLSWGFSNYTCYAPEIDMKLLKSVIVNGGRVNSVTVKAPQISPVLIKKGDEEKVKVTVDLCESVNAPVYENQTLGSVKITVGEDEICQYKITSQTEALKLTYFDCLLKVFNFISNGKTAYPFTNA
ncbi:MAG: D-alanyl-D-alanine carboxypeptidase [Clostridia bacterium]|nr:D-alanyl-D-alanine carboxypeptidase [Clostridia bacterium]